jgi:peptide deformylase
MTRLEIVQLGDPRLRERARDVSADELETPECQQLVDDLIETMRAAEGAGLAATQVGVPLRIFVAEVNDNRRYPYKPELPLHIVVNPVVQPVRNRTYPSYEGCLSIPGLRGLLERSFEIEVAYRDRNGNECRERVRGLSAGTFQHETDHLDGVLFVDRLDAETRKAAMRAIRDAPWADQANPTVKLSAHH